MEDNQFEFQRGSVQKSYGKTQKFRGPFTQLPDSHKAQAYFDLYDENRQLKEKENELEGKIKQLTTQLTRITRDLKHEKQNNPDEEKQKLQQENQQLKNKIKTIRNTNSSTKKKPPNKEVQNLSTDNIIAEKNNLIQRLRDQLQATEVELLRVKGEKGVNEDELTQDYKEKAYYLVELESKFSVLEENYVSLKSYLSHTQQLLKESQSSLRDEKVKNAELKISLKAAELAAQGSKDLLLKIQELSSENKHMEEQIKELCKSPFMLDAANRLASGEKLTKAVNDLHSKLEEVNHLKERILKLEAEKVSLEEQVRKVSIEKNQHKEEAATLKSELDHRAQTVKAYEDQLKRVSEQDADNFMRAVGNVKLQEEYDPSDLYALQKEIDRLKHEKKELTTELDKAKRLLILKADLESEKVTVLERENQSLKQFIERLKTTGNM